MFVDVISEYSSDGNMASDKIRLKHTLTFVALLLNSHFYFYRRTVD
jgi:hypothetical protein